MDQASLFESIRHEQDGVEYWTGRELAKALTYTRWDKFQNVIAKARTACEVSGQAVSDHFLHVGKMVSLGSGAQREIED